MSELIATNIDGDGIATLTWNMEDESVNSLNEASMGAFSDALDAVIANDDVKGIIVTSAKSDFIAGADLKMIRRLADTPAQEIFDSVRSIHAVFGKLENSGKPTVAAINGTALGGGYELALACHRRIAADNPKAQIGLPEVQLGLLPGGGGTQRLPRLIGIRDALSLMTEGKRLKPQKALSKGLIDEVVPGDELLARAKTWILEEGTAKQPWHDKKFRVPGGKVQSPGGYQTFIGGNALARKTTWGNYPAPQAIMACVYHGLQMPLDRGLEYEARKFAYLARTDVSRNMVRSLFFNLQDANKLKRRPEGIEKATFRKVGVLGAGMMGAGIAYQSALCGMQVILIDISQEGADKGKAYSEGLVKKAVGRKRMTEEKGAALLERIVPTTDYALLDGCDIVVEAVFENREIKADVTKKTEAVIGGDAIFATNTSTLPITGLAEASNDPTRFIGLHFFSPVDKMKLVEIIMGEKTSDKTLARSLDYVQAIKRTPIVVNDSRGFYTSRVFKTYVLEGISMLLDGIDPVLIDNAGRMAGMPVGPLALADEVSIELMVKIGKQTKADLGDAYVSHPAEPVTLKMVEELGRLGKKAKKGFYEYPENEKKHIWNGLRDLYPVADEQPSAEAIGERLLTVQAVEAIRCFEENVVTHPADADIGSIFGWGFCPFHGGVLSYVDTVGLQNFVDTANALADKHGERFRAPAKAVEMAEKGEAFHG